MDDSPEVDSSASEACIAWLNEASCDDILADASGTPCAGVIVFRPPLPETPANETPIEERPPGALPDEWLEGDWCNDSGSRECASGLFCSPEHVDASGPALMCSACVSLPALGEPCQLSSGQCAEGHFCSTDQLCAASFGDGESCVEDVECLSRFCHDATLRCDPAGQTDTSCVLDVDCRQGLVCDEATAACRSPSGNGEPCLRDLECTEAPCHLATGTCGLPVGAPCGTSDECATDWCVGSPNRCACTARSGCAADEYCGRQGACQRLRADGEVCDSDWECEADFCDDTCRPRRFGDKCSDHTDCAPDGYCLNVCEPLGDFGDGCQHDSQCEDGLICRAGACGFPAGESGYCVDDDQCMRPLQCSTGRRCEQPQLRCEPAAEGERCAFDEFCVDGTACMQGFCRVPNPLGEPCEKNDHCAGELVCTGACAPAVQESQSCDRNDQCAAGLVCRWQQDRPGRACQPPGTLNEPCSGEETCVATLHCPYPGNNQDRVCAEYVGWGEPCDGREECEPNLRCAEVFLRDVCIGPTDFEPCNAYHPCPSDTHYCSVTYLQCIPRPKSGGACNPENDQCPSGQYCDRGSRRCALPPEVGHPCRGSDTCGPLLTCDTDLEFCREGKQVGEACDQLSCAPHLYCHRDAVTRSRTCKPQLAPGEACDTDSMCQSGLCMYDGEAKRCLVSDACQMP